MQEKNSFLLYLSYNKSVRLMTREDAGELFQAILRYAAGEEVGELSYPVQLVFAYIQERMDYDCDKYTETCEMRAESGKKGGAPKGNQNARKKQPKQPKQAKQAKQPDTDTVTDTETDIDTVADIVTGMEMEQPPHVGAEEAAAEPPKQTKQTIKKEFVPPTVEEVRAYVKEIGGRVDAERFVTHYTQNGWTLSKGGRMTDWKAMVRFWEQQEGDSPQRTDPVSKRMEPCCTLPEEDMEAYMELIDRFLDADAVLPDGKT